MGYAPLHGVGQGIVIGQCAAQIHILAGALALGLGHGIACVVPAAQRYAERQHESRLALLPGAGIDAVVERVPHPTNGA
ncbi:hypothetical protein D3C72_1038870 [compost metagenome]